MPEREAGGVIQVLEPEDVSLTVRVSWRDGEVRVRCPECALDEAGPGKVICPVCGTAGAVECPECGGAGSFDDPEADDWSGWPCAHCRGSGEVSCPACAPAGVGPGARGSSSVTCPECGGAAWVSWDQAGAWLKRQAERVRR